MYTIPIHLKGKVKKIEWGKKKKRFKCWWHELLNNDWVASQSESSYRRSTVKNCTFVEGTIIKLP